MSQCKRVVTAVAGATVALTLVIAPGAIATADPGNRGSASADSDRRDDSGRRGGESSRGSVPSNDVAGNGSRDDSAGSTQQSGATADASSSERSRPSVTTADGARTVRTARTARTADDVKTGGSGLRPAAPVAPTHVDPPVLASTAGAAQPPPPPPPRTAPVNSPVEVRAPQPVAPVPAPITAPVAGLPVADMSLSVLPIGSDPRPGQPMTSLFGILGLLLIPLAGAALGYRQARAARALPPARTSGLPPA